LKLKLEHNPKIFLIEIQRATGQEVAECMTRAVKEIPASPVEVGCVQQLFIIQKLWKVLKRVEERRERRMVGKRIILVLM